MRPATESDRPTGARIRDALGLGVLQGPAEMVPISSSGHATLIPWILGSGYPDLPAASRKTIEVALHAGTAAALIVAPPDSQVRGPAPIRSIAVSLAGLAPTAVAGLVGRRRIGESLGTPATVAAGLAAGSVALLVADRRTGSRKAAEVTPLDGLVSGFAQSAALWPGVSRSAMSIAAFRLRGFGPSDAARLARSGIVPVSIAAAALEGSAAANEGRLLGSVAPACVAAGTAFASTIAARPLATRLERGGKLWPWAVLRLLTAAVAARRIRSLGNDGSR